MIPNLQWLVDQVIAEHPEAFANAHTGNAHTEDFIRILATRAHAIDSNFGLNGKRGNPHDISDDVLNYKGEGPGVDITTGRPSTVIDVIFAAGAQPPYSSSNPAPRSQWAPFADPVASSGAWVDPNAPAAPKPTGPQAPRLPSYEDLGGDEGAKQITRLMERDYQRAGRPGLDGDCGGWLRRVDYDVLSGKIATVDESIRVHRDEWLDGLKLIEWSTGMMSHSKRCLICNASVGFEKGKPRPIPHTAECTQP